MALRIEPFCRDREAEWDDFVLNKSMNGTFLQTRQFINYHAEDKFMDCSLCVRKGEELVATLLACEIEDEGRKLFFAHKGSTYGGITISDRIYSASAMDEMMKLLDEYLKAENYDGAYLKMVPYVYQKTNTDLLDYFLYKYGYTCYDELNYFMHLDRYREDIPAQFSSSKRRDFRYSLQNGLIFKKLETKEDISAYYEILLMNLAKLHLPIVHSLEDLYDLKFARFPERIEFYGVYDKDQMIAGSMIFLFDGGVFHTQYLSSNEEYLKLFPMDYLIEHLIEVAVEKGERIFTFGICTEDQGRYLNLGLSRFKEGFGTEFCINRSYEKHFCRKG